MTSRTIRVEVLFSYLDHRTPIPSNSRTRDATFSDMRSLENRKCKRNDRITLTRISALPADKWRSSRADSLVEGRSLHKLSEGVTKLIPTPPRKCEGIPMLQIVVEDTQKLEKLLDRKASKRFCAVSVAQ